MTFNIKKSELLKHSLSVEEYLILMLLYEKDIETLKELYTELPELSKIENSNYIRINGKTWNDVIITSKTIAIFSTKGENINFDEFWDNFPSETPSGRCLRPKNKMWANELTKDYVEAKKKYLSFVKTIENHKTIVSILVEKSKIAAKADKEYENNILSYINQKKWQKDSKYLQSTQQVNRM